jgi:hypothetical protein
MRRRWRELTVATLLLAGATGCTQHFQIPEPEGITSVADDPRGVEKWILQDTYIASKSSLILALVSDRKEVDAPPYISQTAFMNPSKEAKNILFVNSKDNSSSWLFKGNHQLILEFSTLSVRHGYMPFPMSKKRDEKALYYKVVNHDSNGDGKITRLDSATLAVSDMMGRNYKELVKDVSRVVSAKEVDDSLIFVYQKAGVGYSLQLSLADFRIVSNKMLPKVGQ